MKADERYSEHTGNEKILALGDREAGITVDKYHQQQHTCIAVAEVGIDQQITNYEVHILGMLIKLGSAQ